MLKICVISFPCKCPSNKLFIEKLFWLGGEILKGAPRGSQGLHKRLHPHPPFCPSLFHLPRVPCSASPPSSDNRSPSSAQQRSGVSHQVPLPRFPHLNTTPVPALPYLHWHFASLYKCTMYQCTLHSSTGKMSATRFIPP